MKEPVNDGYEEQVEDCVYLVDGPYASINSPLLLSVKQGNILKEHGYKVLTREEYKEQS